MGMRCAALTALLVLACDDDGGASPDVPAADVTVVDMGPADGSVEPDADPREAARALVLGVEETRSIQLPGLSAEVHVVRTEGDIPHVYATNRLDLARVQGYLVARDRYFMMDLGRRLAQGRIGELVGGLVLDVDITARNQGMRQAGQRILETLPEALGAEFDAFAEGVNVYVDRVAEGADLPPSELALVAPIFGASGPADLMEPFSRADVAAFAATVLFMSGYEATDLEQEVGIQAALEHFAGAPFETLRMDGVVRDIYQRVAPIEPVRSVEAGAAAQPATAARGGASGRALPKLPATARGLLRQVRAMQALLGKSGQREFGSNAWAVAGDRTADGATLVAGDGHLSLSVPSFFVQMGLDTDLFGADGAPHVRGLFIPGLPPLGVGTNGHVAWSFTYFYADVTDWYREELVLGDDGRPEASMFRGEARPLRRVEETYALRAIPALGSEGGPVTVPRWETFDGRRVLAIEGVPVVEGVEPGAGDVVVDLGDGPVIIGDTDGDGVVSAVSMDYTGLDAQGTLSAYGDLAKATNIAEFRDAQRRIGVFGSHFAAGDRAGDILITGYHASPCRRHLPRGADGRFEAGADPTRILDGTRFGAFTVGYTGDGRIDEASDDETRCVVAYDDFPQEVSPARGFVMTANNDPSGLAFDDNLADGDVYVGAGNWALGFRAKEIRAALAATVAAGDGDVARMAEIQATQISVTGRRYAPVLLAAVERARALDAPDDPDEARLAALYTADAGGFDEVARRLAAWGEGGYRPRSGVATFYNAPTDQDREDAAATMLFNAWLGHFTVALLGDEWAPDRAGPAITSRQEMRTVDLALFGRGADNPLGLASWNPETEESVFFDVKDTPEVEGSDEVILMGLRDALAALRAPPAAPGRGGFGTGDMSEWSWGMRHMMVLDSLLSGYVDESAGPIGGLLARFGITPADVPLAAGLENADPRRTLPGFPRGGDNFNVDAGDPGLGGQDYTYRHGPIMRMVIALNGGRVSGRNIIPGGQSGLRESPHRSDQLELYLANDAWPLRYHTEEVAQGALGREVYRP